MGKKKPEEMAKHRAIFGLGAAQNGVSHAHASALYDAMEKFAGYGFNKSHSAPYAYLGYLTAYLKANHGAAFMAANLSCVMDFTDKVQQLFDDARANKLNVLAPDINTGAYRFVATDRNTIQYGLGAVKGTGRGAIENIAAARAAKGRFVDLLDFVKRVDRHTVNRRAIEALIKAGAFDSIDANRAGLLSALPQAIELADKADRDAQQENLFGDATAGGLDVLTPVKVAPWGDRELLKNEKLALGFYLSGHPFASYEREIRQFVKTRLADVQPKDEPVLMCGILIDQRVRNARRGRMCVITLDDGTARIEAVVYNEIFDKKRAIMVDDQPLIIRGTASIDDFSGGMRVIVDEMLGIEDARKFVRSMTLCMNGQADSGKLRQILSRHLAADQPAGCVINIRYSNGVGEVPITLPDNWRVRVSDPLLEDLYRWLSPSNVDLQYETANMLPPPARRFRNASGGGYQAFQGGEY